MRKIDKLLKWILSTFYLPYVGCGHFIFFEASKCPSDTFGFLETPPELPKSQQYCIKFSMMMYSNKFPEQMGSLTLYLFQYQQTTKQVFHHDGISTNNRSQWIPVEVDLFLTNSTMPFGVSQPKLYPVFGNHYLKIKWQNEQ